MHFCSGWRISPALLYIIKADIKYQQKSLKMKDWEIRKAQTFSLGKEKSTVLFFISLGATDNFLVNSFRTVFTLAISIFRRMLFFMLAIWSLYWNNKIVNIKSAYIFCRKEKSSNLSIELVLKFLWHLGSFQSAISFRINNNWGMNELLR